MEVHAVDDIDILQQYIRWQSHFVRLRLSALRYRYAVGNTWYNLHVAAFDVAECLLDTLQTKQAQSHRKYWDKSASPMPETQPGTPWLDGGYTVFGEVIYGLDIVDKIQQTKTDKNDRPLTDIRLLKMEVMN